MNSFGQNSGPLFAAVEGLTPQQIMNAVMHGQGQINDPNMLSVIQHHWATWDRASRIYFLTGRQIRG